MCKFKFYNILCPIQIVIYMLFIYNNVVSYKCLVFEYNYTLSQTMCAPYWPDEVGKTLQFNDYIIELVESNEFEDYIQRQFKLTNETVSGI